jgi:hypothetical protein
LYSEEKEEEVVVVEKERGRKMEVVIAEYMR